MRKFLYIVLFLFLFNSIALAGGTIQWPTLCWFDSNGDPLSGGKLYSYIAGTTTNKSLYSDRAATTPHTNPVILDSNGCAEIYGTGTYKLILKDSADSATYFSDDNIGILEDPAVINTLADEATPSISVGTTFLTGGTTTITDFDDGVTGKMLVILSEHSVTIENGSNIFLEGSADFGMEVNDSLALICKANNKWYELYRSVNAPQPVAKWDMENITGTTVPDEVGSYTGTAVGSPSVVEDTADNSTYSIDLNGTSQYITVNDDDIFSLNTTGKSISFWLKADVYATSDNKVVAAKGGTDDSDQTKFEWWIYINSSMVIVYIWDTTGTNLVRYEYVPLVDAAWHHYVVVFHGNTYTDDIEIYKDGVESSVYVTSVDLTYANETGELHFGHSQDPGFENWLDGHLDNIQWYNTVLNQNQVDALYAGE